MLRFLKGEFVLGGCLVFLLKCFIFSAQWGFHPGGWGKPPLDEYNRPLYGDVFGVLPKAGDSGTGEPIDKELWGELEPEEEEEEEEESEAESDEEETREPAPSDGLQTPSGLETPSGMTSVVSTVAGGLETPDFLELRKGRSVSDAMEASGPRSLYQVVPEKQTSVRGLMGSERGYDVSAVASAPLPVLGEERGTKRKNGVDVSLDAGELEGLSEEELRRKYEAHARGNAGVPGAGSRGEDFSDMVAKEMAKKKQKMDRERDGRKGGKEFKF